MYRAVLKKWNSQLFKTNQSLCRLSQIRSISYNYHKFQKQTVHNQSCTIKIQKFHINHSIKHNTNTNQNISIHHNVLHKSSKLNNLSLSLLFPFQLSHKFSTNPSSQNEQTNDENTPTEPNEEYPTDDIPISERPDWVLIGFEDARNVFRLTESQLQEIRSIRKGDPYRDDEFNIDDENGEAQHTWYYVRDVWQKSCDIYGTEVVDAWYKRFTADVGERVSYEALYGWRNEDVLPQETPLFKWIFSHKFNELLSQSESAKINKTEGGGVSVVKRAIRANASKLAITYLLYLYTSAYSLWAETLHSICDLTNQGLLFLSIRLASTDPDFNHPYGYGASRWVVSFLSGTILFGMGLNAMYGSLEGVLSHKFHVISDVRIGILLCAVSAVLEMYSFAGAYKEIKSHLKRERGAYTMQQYLAHGTDSTSIHVFLEDGTGLLCSLIAASALTATHLSNYSTVLYDVIGSTVIGASLSGIGLVLMLRNGKLLSGRSVQNNTLLDTIKYLHSCDVIASFHDLKSMIVGMNTCVIKVEVNFNADKVAEKHIKTSAVFDEFKNKCLRNNDIDAFHDLMMKSCADYQQWVVTERSLIEIGIKEIVKNYGYDRVHVDIETY